MNRLNLPNQLDSLIVRLKVKTAADGYTSVLSLVSAQKPIHWYNMPNTLKDVTNLIKAYQAEAIDGNLQDIIDELTIINWFNVLISANKIKTAIELIESL